MNPRRFYALPKTNNRVRSEHSDYYLPNPGSAQHVGACVRESDTKDHRGMKILDAIFQGFWMGLGAELSFFQLWLIWKLLHGKFARRLHPEHWLHEIAKYFE